MLRMVGPTLTRVPLCHDVPYRRYHVTNCATLTSWSKGWWFKSQLWHFLIKAFCKPFTCICWVCSDSGLKTQEAPCVAFHCKHVKDPPMSYSSRVAEFLAGYVKSCNWFCQLQTCCSMGQSGFQLTVSKVGVYWGLGYLYHSQKITNLNSIAHVLLSSSV